MVTMIRVITGYLNEFIQIFDKAEGLFDVLRFLALVVSTICILSFRKFKIIARRTCLHRLIGFNKNLPIEVMLPTFTGNLDYTPKEMVRRGEKIKTVDYITLDESNALLYLQNLVHIYEMNGKIILKGSDKSFSTASNKVLIGGPLNNKYLHDIFSKNKSSIFSFNGRFKFGVKSYWVSRRKNDFFTDIEEMLPTDDSPNKLLYLDKKGNKNTISIKSRYIILIKLNKNDLQISNTGPLLICFGDSAFSTNKSVQCLTESLYDLSKHIRNKSHYFVVLKCTEHGDIQFAEKDGIIDLTDIML